MKTPKPSNTCFTSTIKNVVVMALAILAIGCDETGVDTVDIRSDESNTRNASGKHQVTAVIQIHPTESKFFPTTEKFIANEIASLSLGKNLTAAASKNNWKTQDIDPNNIQKNLVVTQIPETDMARITLHSDDPDQAKKIINDIISSYVNQRKTTEEDRAKKALQALGSKRFSQSDLVQDCRKELTVLIQQYGIPYFDGGSDGNHLGASEKAMFQSARAKLADLETELALLSAKNEALERDEDEQAKLTLQLEVLEKQVPKMRNIVDARKKHAISLSLKQTNYTQAKEYYEQARRVLREMKKKHTEAEILLKMPRDPITIRQLPK